MSGRPWPHSQGPTCLVLEPLDVLRRLAALIPAPYAHMVRYHGCFANRARARDLLPAPPAPVEVRFEAQVPSTRYEDAAPAGGSPTAQIPLPARRRPLPWAQLLGRVFFIDALRCPRCATAMVILAFLSDPPVVAKILRHVRLPTAPPPLAPARGGGGSGAWGGSVTLPSPPDDPVTEVPERAETCVSPPPGMPDPAEAGLPIRPPP